MVDSPASPANDNLRPCPICGLASTLTYRPFCSRRCADVDLNRWLTGAYAIPAEEEDEGVPEADAPPPSRRD